jgi:hypothetical protein
VDSVTRALRVSISLLSACAAVVALAVPGSALAGWGPPESVEPDINGIALAPGGTGFVLGFPATSPSRVRFALRPPAGPVGLAQEFPAGFGQHTLPKLGFDEAGDALIVDEEPGLIGWRAASGLYGTTQKLEGHLLARQPRLISVAPSGAALIGVNEQRPGGSPVQLAFRPAGPDSVVDTENTVDLTTKGTLVGLQLEADGGAIAVYIDEVTDKLMQAVRNSGQVEFETPTEIPTPPGTHDLGEIIFSSDSSGWAMLAASGRSAEGGEVDQVLGDVRAPGGSFPTPSVIATGSSLSNVTPAVTASGDGLVTWKQGGLGDPLCSAVGIRGAAEHLGTWSAAMAVGPEAWPDESLPATANTSFSSGNDISVPMIEVHAEGSPCPTSPQTRGLIVHHYRCGPRGLTDQGVSELAPASSSSPVLVEGWAMEPAGKILAWYRVGEERFLRSFDGVTPGAGTGLPGTPGSPEVPGSSGGAGSGASGSGSTGTGTTTKPAVQILPLKLQQFAIVPTINPASLEFEMRCPPIGEESCQGRAYFEYLLTGKQIKPAKGDAARASTAPKTHLAVIATGQVKIKAGQHGRIRMRPNALGKSLLKGGKKLKITLKLAVTQGQSSVTGTLPATIKAAKGSH